MLLPKLDDTYWPPNFLADPENVEGYFSDVYLGSAVPEAPTTIKFPDVPGVSFLQLGMVSSKADGDAGMNEILEPGSLVTRICGW